MMWLTVSDSLFKHCAKLNLLVTKLVHVYSNSFHFIAAIWRMLIN